MCRQLSMTRLEQQHPSVMQTLLRSCTAGSPAAVKNPFSDSKYCLAPLVHARCCASITCKKCGTFCSVCTGSYKRLLTQNTSKQCGDGSLRLKLITNYTLQQLVSCMHASIWHMKNPGGVRRAIYIHTPTKSRLATVAAQTAALQACLGPSNLAYQPGAASLRSLE